MITVFHFDKNKYFLYKNKHFKLIRYQWITTENLDNVFPSV